MKLPKLAALLVMNPSAGTLSSLAAACTEYHMTSVITQQTPPSSEISSASLSLNGAAQQTFSSITSLAMSSDATTSAGTLTGTATKLYSAG